PGRVLFEITDESSMWVESRARPEEATQISNQVPAKIKFQNSWFEGKVIQVQHVIDEETRTLPVRLEVKNKIHLLHPGQFVEVRLKLTGASTVMAVPKAAALRNAEGEWIVFVEDTPGAYRPVDVIPVRTSGDQLIVEGLSPGMRIVTKGAFFLQSELAKSGFDVHNH
ncbi:MAG TPA: efflux RND transporter periplasmic adaptor subunit, partial [Gammaproteobacteria bacterium]